MLQASALFRRFPFILRLKIMKCLVPPLLLGCSHGYELTVTRCPEVVNVVMSVDTVNPDVA